MKKWMLAICLMFNDICQATDCFDILQAVDYKYILIY